MSDKSDFDTIIDGIDGLVKIILEKDPDLSMKETMNKLFEICPGFRQDKLFLDCFPSVYYIHICNVKLAEQDKNI